MKFRVSNLLYDCGWKIYLVDGEPTHIASFPDNEHGKAMAHDYCDFLNDKYLDKEINKEWPKITRKERIDYHLNELRKLTSDKRLYWNEHGNGVESGGDTG